MKRVFTKTHKENISKACKGRISWNKGLKQNREHLLKNMKAHLKYDVSLEWLNNFEDIEKLKYLNHSIARERDYRGFTTEIYKKFIERFYKDRKFNQLFIEWSFTKNKWIKPSLDHIQAKCKGGTLLLDNLQFISWFENRAKMDIPQVVWNEMKNNLKYYL